jgi:hypothetical protein
MTAIETRKVILDAVRHGAISKKNLLNVFNIADPGLEANRFMVWRIAAQVAALIKDTWIDVEHRATGDFYTPRRVA